MKASLTLILLTSCVAFAEPSLPDFSTKFDPVPGLSLSGAIKAGTLTRIPQAQPAHRQSKPARRMVSRMPVVEPTDLVDRNMPIMEPSSAVDYSLIVKEPGVVSKK